MKYFFICLCFFLQACSTLKIPNTYQYKEITTSTFTLASWQKLTNSYSPIRIYVEGDGYAFDQNGKATNDPTPISTIVRKLAFNDYNPNVIYFARPCQFIQNALCTKDCWSIGRFSQNAIQALYEASKKIAKQQEIIFIGYSGGALLTGLVIQEYKDLNVIKWITLAGLLDHKAWSDYLHLYPLTKSLNLNSLPTINQIHFIGEKDNVIPLDLQRKITKNKNLYIIKNATHNKNLEQIFPLIYQE